MGGEGRHTERERERERERPKEAKKQAKLSSDKYMQQVARPREREYTTRRLCLASPNFQTHLNKNISRWYHYWSLFHYYYILLVVVVMVVVDCRGVTTVRLLLLHTQSDPIRARLPIYIMTG